MLIPKWSTSPHIELNIVQNMIVSKKLNYYTKQFPNLDLVMVNLLKNLKIKLHY